MSDKAELGFKDLLASRGYTGKIAEELWKWFDPSEKRGVASF
jgi:hypothetical protein